MTHPLRRVFLVAMLLHPPFAWCADLSAARVGQAIAERRDHVPEFRLIKQAAEELGLRVWLFGGTAAGFAHYVRWDMARESGEERYRESFFDYDFTNIYRSTQDADLVVDATPEQAERLEGLIRQKMSFLQGSKEHWEVRLLRSPRGATGGQVKLPLLDNPDFLEQNTDSNSTGMIELTDPPAGEAVVRDLRDWRGPTPFFLQDVTDGRLHYYGSATHRQTSRYLSGDNPEIFSVLRYLVKAFQYDLQVNGKDLEEVQSIIEAFDPRHDYARLSPWAKGWLERYGPNLVRHSVNVEHAWETLDRLGLRTKLISLSDPSKVGSLGWWLSREPLRSAPVGEGAGKTAAELGINVVAHETSSFLAYESITRDTTLRPNVLISRPSQPGETATYGPGFYTVRGRTGARGTGLTIRFKVDPGAREGTDFTWEKTYTGQGEFVIFHNRAALQVIPESLDATLLEYFQMLQAGVVDPADRGAWMKLKRRLSLRPLSPEEESAIAMIVSDAIVRTCHLETIKPLPVLGEWFSLPLSNGHPELVEQLKAKLLAGIEWLGPTRPEPPNLSSDKHRRTGLYHLAREWLALPDSGADPAVTGKIAGLMGQEIDRMRGKRARSPLYEPTTTIEAVEAEGDLLRALLRDWFTLPVSGAHPELEQQLVEVVSETLDWEKSKESNERHWDNQQQLRLMRFWIGLPVSRRYPELLERMVLRFANPSFIERGYINSGTTEGAWDRFLDHFIREKGWPWRGDREVFLEQLRGKYASQRAQAARIATGAASLSGSGGPDPGCRQRPGSLLP